MQTGSALVEPIENLAFSSLIEQLFDCEQRFPYHRNDCHEKSNFQHHLPKLISLIAEFKKKPLLLGGDSLEQANVVSKLIKIIRRISEYSLSVKRDCDYAIEYNVWAISLYDKYINQAQSLQYYLQQDLIQLMNHLAFAYYFQNEMGKQDPVSLTHAQSLLENALAINQGQYYQEMGYAHCVLGQISMMQGSYEAARHHFIQAYQTYAQKKSTHVFDQNQALYDLKQSIHGLNDMDNVQHRSDLYQQTIVLEYFADNEVHVKAYAFAEHCYYACMQFIQTYWQKDTLQVADLYYRLGNLMMHLTRTQEAYEFYQCSLEIYQKLAGKRHRQSMALTRLLQGMRNE